MLGRANVFRELRSAGPSFARRRNAADRSDPTLFLLRSRRSHVMKVLLGLGGGDDSLRALERTVNRAADAGDDLTVAILDDPGADPSVADVEREAESALAAAGIDAEIRRVDGDLGSELVTMAEAEGFDRIAIGGGTTSPMGKIQLGSTAEFVLLNSHVTVSLVR